MNSYNVFYHFSEERIWNMVVEATNKFEAIGKIQVLFGDLPNFSIIKVKEYKQKSFWYTISNKDTIKKFYKCSNCGHCVATPEPTCSHCGRSMSIWKEI